MTDAKDKNESVKEMREKRQMDRERRERKRQIDRERRERKRQIDRERKKKDTDRQIDRKMIDIRYTDSDRERDKRERELIREGGERARKPGFACHSIFLSFKSLSVHLISFSL